ncbi:hypothetical protein Tco_0976401 [Tanacetum coccineum]|uniref:Uncharacterized protein n=1 Tax=Tanacetum coccineum TaxID=301880 RepID=A0ABQ5EH38_9ASTR
MLFDSSKKRGNRKRPDKARAGFEEYWFGLQDFKRGYRSLTYCMADAKGNTTLHMATRKDGVQKEVGSSFFAAMVIADVGRIELFSVATSSM